MTVRTMTRLDGALGSLGWYEMWRLVVLPVVGGWSFMILEVPSIPSHSTRILSFAQALILTAYKTAALRPVGCRKDHQHRGERGMDKGGIQHRTHPEKDSM